MPTSGVVVEDIAQLAGEGLRLADLTELAAEEAAVVARERGRLVTEQFAGGERRASDEREDGYA